MVHYAGHRLLDLLPDLQRDALDGAAAALAAVHTAHRCKAPLQRPQDLPHGVRGRGAGQQIAAAGAPDAAHQAGAGEGGDDLLQVFIGNLLPLGHVPKGDRLPGRGQGQVQHQPQGVAALGGNFHAIILILKSIPNCVPIIPQE